MGIFDFFKGKKKDDNFSKKIPASSDGLSLLFEPSIDHGVLEKVYKHNIKNGVFSVPKEVVLIESCAFMNCDNLEEVVLHSGVRFIAPDAFHNCKNLKRVVGLGNLTEMNNVGGFSKCSGLEEVVLPKTTEVVCEAAFYSCNNLKTVNIPQKCKIISNHAFENCTSLQQLELPAKTSIIQSDAFKGCHNLTVMFAERENVHETDYEFEEQYNHQVGLEVATGAFSGVKNVCAYDMSVIERVISSGYRGFVTYFDRNNEQAVTIDLSVIDKFCLEDTKTEDEFEPGKE